MEEARREQMQWAEAVARLGKPVDVAVGATSALVQARRETRDSRRRSPIGLSRIQFTAHCDAQQKQKTSQKSGGGHAQQTKSGGGVFACSPLSSVRPAMNYDLKQSGRSSMAGQGVLLTRHISAVSMK